MAIVTRQLRIAGRLMASPTAATITVNGNEAYSGPLASGEPLDTEDTTLAVVNYQGSDSDLDPLTINIEVTSGVVKFGLFWVNSDSPEHPWIYDFDDLDTDCRSNILINGLPPEWPASPVEPMPKGTEEAPNWSGWNFEVSAGETFSCNYLAVSPVYSLSA